MRLPSFKFNASSLLVLLAGLITAGFLVSASLDLWGISGLKKEYSESGEVEVIKKGSSKFALKAHYCFENQGKTYHGKTIFSKPYHLNRLSAEKQIKIIPLSSACLVPTQHPEHSSIERLFPFKNASIA